MGRSISRFLAKQDVSLAVCDLNPQGLSELAEELNLSDSKFYQQAVDVTDATAVEAFVKQAGQKFGRIDGMCHCAVR
jgi:3-oxoacyl-[acyl-carrier protein] reductase